MMVLTYAEHQALAARQRTPRPRPPRLPGHPKGDNVGCWHCALKTTGHSRRDCRKRLAEGAAHAAGATDGGGASLDRGRGGGGGRGGGEDSEEVDYAAKEQCHLVLVADGVTGP